MVKIAISGKGGVGKTTITAGLARALSKQGYRIVVLDMDPSPNLLSSLGCDSKIDIEHIKPLMEMKDLIEEKTGAPQKGYGLVFKLNPKVDDILDRFGVNCKDNVRLLVMGSINQGGEGCFCPANTLAKRLVDYLSGSVDFLLMDMEAGVEHLGRGTTRTVEILLIVVEPSIKAVEAAKHIKKLAQDLSIRKVFAILNKVKNKKEENIIKGMLEAMKIPVIYSIPYDPAMTKADLQGLPIFDIEEGKNMNKCVEELSKILTAEYVLKA
ncbi:MAG: P-loop NTPase [Nitrososphaerales archaeon]